MVTLLIVIGLVTLVGVMLRQTFKTATDEEMVQHEMQLMANRVICEEYSKRLLKQGNNNPW